MLAVLRLGGTPLRAWRETGRLVRDFLSIKLEARPIRGAVFVPAVEDIPWQRVFESALATQTRCWGGSANLLFPADAGLQENLLFWRILDRFDPDIVILHQPLQADLELLDHERWRRERGAAEAELVAAFPSSGVDMGLEDWDSALLTDKHVSGEVIEQIWRRFATLTVSGQPVQAALLGESLPATFPLTEIADALWSRTEVVEPAVVQGLAADVQLLLTARLGRVPRGLANHRGLDHSRRPLANLGSEVLFDDSAEPWPWRALSDRGVAWYRSSFLPPPVLIVSGGDVWDFALYYALSRMRGNVFWFPELLRAEGSYAARVRAVVRANARRTAEEVLVVSASGRPESETMDAVDAALNPAGVSGAIALRSIDAERTLEVPPMRLRERQPNLPATVPLIDGLTPELPTPVPRGTGLRARNLRWMADVEVAGWAATRNRHSGSYLVGGSGSSWPASSDNVRVGRDGIAYACPNIFQFAGQPIESSVPRPQLRPLNLFDQLSAVAEAQAWTCETSDKGVYAEQSAALLGGYNELARILAEVALRPLWQAYLAPGSASVGLRLAGERRTYLTGPELTHTLGMESADQTLHGLEQSGVLRRGLVLKCERCRQAAWYGLDQFGSVFVCRRCELSQAVGPTSWLPSSAEPIWQYGLAEVVFQLLSHDGDLPVLAAQVALGSGGEPRAQAYELDLVSPDGQTSELDIVVSVGAELWIGEASKSAYLSKNGTAERARVARLRRIADLFDAYGVIAATSSPEFRSATRGRLTSAIGEPAHRLMMLQGVGALPAAASGL